MHDHTSPNEIDRFCFTSDGAREPIVDFPYAEVDGEPEAVSPFVLAGEGLAQMLKWCWRSRRRVTPPDVAFKRFMAASAAVNPELMGNVSYEELGRKNGITKQWVSKLAVEFSDEFKIHFRRSRREGSREVFKNAQLRRKAS
jgi:hypothetical protein